MTIRPLLTALCLLAMVAIARPTAAQSQTPPVSAVRITVAGGVSPVTNDLDVASVTCALPKASEPTVIPGTTHNPTELDWDDPADPTPATHYCRYKDTGAVGTPSPLLALPFGATVYTATARFIYGPAGPGPASVVSSPFDHPGLPGTIAPTGFRVSQ